EYGTQPGHPRMIIEDVVPVGETDVGPGEHVHATDGEIGRVQGFFVDSGDHRVTHVLLQEGHFWGRKEVAIPISAVTGFDGGIRSTMAKKRAEELPRVSGPCPGLPHPPRCSLSDPPATRQGWPCGHGRAPVSRASDGRQGIWREGYARSPGKRLGVPPAGSA